MSKISQATTQVQSEQEDMGEFVRLAKLHAQSALAYIGEANDERSAKIALLVNIENLALKTLVAHYKVMNPLGDTLIVQEFENLLKWYKKAGTRVEFIDCIVRLADFGQAAICNVINEEPYDPTFTYDDLIGCQTMVGLTYDESTKLANDYSNFVLHFVEERSPILNNMFRERLMTNWIDHLDEHRDIVMRYVPEERMAMVQYIMCNYMEDRTDEINGGLLKLGI